MALLFSQRENHAAQCGEALRGWLSIYSMALLRSKTSISILVMAISLGPCVKAGAQKPGPPVQEHSAISGKQTFGRRCAGCHGLDGRGGERGPNIADKTEVRRMSNAQLAEVISNGRSDFGMPAFGSIGAKQINAVVAFLRTLQGVRSSSQWAGDFQRGKALFFGKTGCSECHMVSGQGGFVGPDLSNYGQSLTQSEIRLAITNADARSSHTKTATATMMDGSQITGVIRNEDNFSIQLQTASGEFHFVGKQDVRNLRYETGSLMPSDYGNRLSSKELDDLINFLHNIKIEPKRQSNAEKED